MWKRERTMVHEDNEGNRTLEVRLQTADNVSIIKQFENVALTEAKATELLNTEKDKYELVDVKDVQEIRDVQQSVDVMVVEPAPEKGEIKAE